MEAAILDAVRRRGGRVADLDAVISVVEAGPDGSEPGRRAARRLVASGEIEMVQRGRVVDPSTTRGAVGVRRAR